ncbi:MAG TPA: DUF6220 domain-containing protein [Candidatus Limnocylindrales bacterium]|nr:DUF6220 domain-containing protein [Candidatus Limnocylindrales bacterium]
MIRAARLAYLVLSAAFLVGMVAQVFLAGMFNFGESSYRSLHQVMGYSLHFVPVLILVAAWFSRAGKRHWQWAAALAVVTLIFPLLPAISGGNAIISALHPVGAFVAFGLAAFVARNAWQAYQLGTESAPGV